MNNFADYIYNYTAGKSVCILGFGREGRSTYKILSKFCSPASIAIADLNHISRADNNLPDSVELLCGESYQDGLDRFDLVFKSPGIVLQRQPDDLKCKITSETQVFFEVFRDQIIGITGTKGKSTVTSLIYHILKESGKDSRIAGNIGIPVFDIAESINDDTIIVCELSCHQLEYMSVSPKTAVFLNLYEEHLDHYGSMDKYFAAKKNIFLHQLKGDSLFINSDVPIDDTYATIYHMSADKDNAHVFVKSGNVRFGEEMYSIPADSIKLIGIHNHYNIAAAYAVCSQYGVSSEDFTKALCTFDPLAHRLEYVDTVNGVMFYDDSISTACATAIEAVKSVPRAGSILIGGMDRGIDYSPLVDFLKSTDIITICMEASGKRVYDMLNAVNAENIYYVQHLEDAVELAAKITPENKSCILSPAAASYGIFKNFEVRGDRFKELVRELKNTSKEI